MDEGRRRIPPGGLYTYRHNCDDDARVRSKLGLNCIGVGEGVGPDQSTVGEDQDTIALSIRHADLCGKPLNLRGPYAIAITGGIAAV